MSLTPDEQSFLAENHRAAMITVAGDGVAKAMRVAVALIDGKLQSSGTQDRVRTGRLRKDPRCTLFVFDDRVSYLTLETTVTILEGPDAPALNLRLFRDMQGKPSGPLTWYGEELDEEQFLRRMSDERRLIYEFAIHRAYGMH